ncbi:MAG TPA: HD domain-containing protein [Thermomicrobiales bacterium]|nr:HD domain-containing protein [Thermomicrobiales bacterium]
MEYSPAALPAELITILAMCDPADAERLAMAFQFAAAAHSGQRRDEGSPFIDHPVAVAVILWQELGCRDPDVLLAALMHDVVEDCDWIDSDAIRDLIGPRAMEMVMHVTKRSVPPHQRAVRDSEYLDLLLHLPLPSRLLKLADRIHNLRRVPLAGNPAKAGRYLDISRERFYPLAIGTDSTAARLLADACDAIELYLDDLKKSRRD